MTAPDMAGSADDLFRRSSDVATPCAIGDLAAQLCGAFPALAEQRAIADARACLAELEGKGWSSQDDKV